MPLPGSGTREDPYLVATYTDLLAVDGVTSTYDDNAPYFVQTDDIYFPEGDYDSINLNGSYNGMGYEIYDWYSTTGGLFHSCSHGKTWNVIMRNAHVETHGIDDVGIICNHGTGEDFKFNMVINGYVKATAYWLEGQACEDEYSEEECPRWEGAKNVGGMVGYTENDILNSSIFDTTVEGRANVGGLVGYLDGNNRAVRLVADTVAHCDVYLMTLEEDEIEGEDPCRYLGGVAGRVEFIYPPPATEPFVHRYQYITTAVDVYGNQFDNGKACIGIYLDEVEDDEKIVRHNYHNTDFQYIEEPYEVSYERDTEALAKPYGAGGDGYGYSFNWWRLYAKHPRPREETGGPIQGHLLAYAHKNVFHGYPFCPPFVEIKYTLDGSLVDYGDVIQIENQATEDRDFDYLNHGVKKADDYEDHNPPDEFPNNVYPYHDIRFLNIKYMHDIDIRLLGMEGYLPNDVLIEGSVNITSSDHFDYEITDKTGSLTFTSPSRQISSVDDLFNIRYDASGTYTIVADLDFTGWTVPDHHPQGTNERGRLNQYSEIYWGGDLDDEVIYNSVRDTTFSVDGFFQIEDWYNRYLRDDHTIQDLVLEGQEHLLSNLNMEIGKPEVALFGNMMNSTVKDLIMDHTFIKGVGSNATITIRCWNSLIENIYIPDLTIETMDSSNYDGTSAIAVDLEKGYDADWNIDENKICEVRQCFANGSMNTNIDEALNAESNAGGLVCRSTGENSPHHLIEESRFIGEIISEDRAGGILGSGHAEIKNCFARADLFGDLFCAGIVAEFDGGTIDRSYYVGQMKGEGSFNAIAGDFSDPEGEAITLCYYDYTVLNHAEINFSHENPGAMPATTPQMSILLLQDGSVAWIDVIPEGAGMRPAEEATYYMSTQDGPTGRSGDNKLLTPDPEGAGTWSITGTGGGSTQHRQVEDDDLVEGDTIAGDFEITVTITDLSDATVAVTPVIVWQGMIWQISTASWSDEITEVGTHTFTWQDITLSADSTPAYAGMEIRVSGTHQRRDGEADFEVGTTEASFKYTP